MTHHATALNLASILDHTARLMPDRGAITCAGPTVTYAELEQHAQRVASALTAIGIAPGEHVALSCPNVPWFPIAYNGILKAGGVVVPLNVLLKPREVAYEEMAAYKYPRSLEFRAALPISPTGKILKRELKSAR